MRFLIWQFGEFLGNHQNLPKIVNACAPMPHSIQIAKFKIRQYHLGAAKVYRYTVVSYMYRAYSSYFCLLSYTLKLNEYHVFLAFNNACGINPCLIALPEWFIKAQIV